MASWSRLENEAIVADYLDMLLDELLGRPFNKSQHRRALSKKLEHRSDRAIEDKRQNISAVLTEYGFPCIDGYKPLGNYQDELSEVVLAQLAVRKDVVVAIASDVARPGKVPSVEDILVRLEAPPEREKRDRRVIRGPAAVRHATGVINYLQREAQNASLGRAGEEFVVNYERARLIHAGKGKLADRVEHVALTQGDGLGFDVRSFEANGGDRLIEVKTTTYGKYIPFFVTRNELQVSRDEADAYQLYRLFHFRRDPRLFSLPGALDQSCDLDPAVYTARVA